MGKKNISNRVAKLENNARPEVKYNDGVSGAFDTVGSINGTLLQPQELA